MKALYLFLVGETLKNVKEKRNSLGYLGFLHSPHRSKILTLLMVGIVKITPELLLLRLKTGN